MSRLAAAAVLAGSILLAGIPSAPASARADATSGAVTTIPPAVACARLAVKYESQVFTFFGCNGPKGFKKATGDFTALWDSGQTALTWNGGTVVEVSIPTVTQSDDYCPAPPITDTNKFLESVVAMSGGGITASVCMYELFHRSNGPRLDPSLVPGTGATIAT